MNFGDNNNQGGLPFISTYKVSITTVSDIRYEGTLYQVNPEKKNIVLTNVISFGTEGRTPNNEILGSNVVHDSIVFEGKDIKDLVVLDNANEQNVNQQNPPITPGENQLATTEFQNIEKKPENESQKPEEQKKNDPFDFQLMNEKFQKLTLKDAKTNDKEFGKYVKNSFFDNISNSTTEKTKETKEERIHQNQIDKETFGNDLLMAKKNQKYNKGNPNNKYKSYRGGYKNQSYHHTNNNYKYNNEESGGYTQKNYYHQSNEGGSGYNYYQNNEGGPGYRTHNYSQGGYRNNYNKNNTHEGGGGHYYSKNTGESRRGGYGYGSGNRDYYQGHKKY